MGAVQGSSIDLQQLHACGADCGGDLADAWLRWRRGRGNTRGTVYDLVRDAYARLGRRVQPADLLTPSAEPSTEPTERPRAVAPPTLPPGPPPIKVTAPCRATPSDVASAPAPAEPSPLAPVKEPAMSTKRLEIQVTAPHPLFPRVMDACKQRGINRVVAIREMRISTGSWHALTHGTEIGPRLTAKIEAWLAGKHAQHAAKPAKPAAKSAAKPARREPQAVPQPMPVDLLRALVRQLNLPVVRAWIIKDDQLCERQAVVLA